jgi:predicted nucleotidyltransferase
VETRVNGIVDYAGGRAAFSQRWKNRRMWLFGSVLRSDFTPESDVDIMVEFETDARWSLLDIVRMGDELSNAPGRPVDLVERSAVEKSDNSIRRRHALNSAERIYGERRGIAAG